ncbi:hypothetical protein HDU87_005316 [Geranomyces variabilis]|uniref:Uncharacterized protein n=1 Tax=Geranomyces variabilis TaxID=109894 RepID=A0AAD5TH99_9FUNG|nr:hypothetical protein HDU87_005316 [Geranomyces variabilis]
MFAKSLSLAVAVAALGAVAQLPTDLPFPIPTDVTVPSVPELPTGTLPSGLPTIPTVPASTSASVAASASSSAINDVSVGFATGCLATQQLKTPNITSQADADGAFQSIAKCVCNLILPMQADITRYDNQCPDPTTGKTASVDEKAQADKNFVACKAGDYATAAAAFGVSLTSGGKTWNATAPGGGAAKSSSATSVSSFAAVGLAGLVAAGFALLA